METKIVKKIEEIEEQILTGIIDIVKIESVLTPPSKNAPYGEGIKKALDQTLSLANNIGLETINIDNQIGYAKLGTSNDYVCAIGHLDVVPVGVGWKHPPFSGYNDGTRIYSRGILDNKGPIISCLYGLYVLKELGYKPQKEIRVIFGCDEESGFRDLEYYLTKEQPPIYGFTPDCKYPVIYSERGRLVIKIEAQLNQLPEFSKYMNEYILNTSGNGVPFGIDHYDEEYGHLEIRNYRLDIQESACLYFSITYPPTITYEEIVNAIQKVSKDFQVVVEKHFEPVFFEKDSFLIKELQKTYEEVTGLDGTPVTTTGGTYAKMMPNIVPFGPSFPGQKGIGHLPNEWMNIEDIMTNAKIYALSLYRLSQGEK